MISACAVGVGSVLLVIGSRTAGTGGGRVRGENMNFSLVHKGSEMEGHSGLRRMKL